MHRRLIVSALIFGVIATFLCARIDDAMNLVGRGRVSPPEIAADASSMMVRQRGFSSVEISFSHVGSDAAVPSDVFTRASTAAWSTDPLAGMGATNWVGPVHYLFVFRQGWPLHAFTASLTPEGGVKGGLTFGGPRTMRVVALAPLWSGLLGNSFLFASVFCLALSALQHIRQTLRKRAGLCPRCCYTKRGIPAGAPCPECGHS